jgi:amino acid transporter
VSLYLFFKLIAQLLTLIRWSNAAYVLNEVKNPVRTLKIAGPLGLSVCGTLYIFANIAYFSALTPAELSKSGVTVASAFMGKVFGEAGQRALR